MPISAHLLERAYQLIDANQLQNAELVLDAVVRVDPKNVLAWKAYLQVCQDDHDLEWLMERILKNRELSDKDKEEFRNYQNYLLQSLNGRKHGMEKIYPRSVDGIEPEQESTGLDGTVTFELIDEFDYPVRTIERVNTRRKPRQMFKYKIPGYVWEAAALLVLFYVGIRLLVLGYLFGYLVITAFIIGGGYWLKNLNASKTIIPSNITHAYSLESENDLFIIDKPVAEAKKDKKTTTPRIRYLDK